MASYSLYFGAAVRALYERAETQPACEADGSGVLIEPLRLSRQPSRYSEDDLHVRQFRKTALPRQAPKSQFRAA